MPIGDITKVKHPNIFNKHKAIY